ncbi:hypothetical protein FB45DRAFT_1056764 [Roridomyces roridus]|uniref:DUF6534 domain-containing protein n=1 Tax=Roridomyces roridus TaxID=1738132 RepID=A0AAD7BZ83_9AGAR|nr:hypothetical protein FB45DRAFT_1056764 [Roridomyces roridus]
MRPISSLGPAELAHGPFFIGLFLNVLLYGIMASRGVNQIYIYYTKYPSDKTWTKTFIAFIFFLDTLNTLFDFAYLYDCLIIHFDDVPYLARANWLFALDPLMTAAIASSVQLFYAWRVKALTGSYLLAMLVVTFAVAGFGTSSSLVHHGIQPLFLQLEASVSDNCVLKNSLDILFEGTCIEVLRLPYFVEFRRFKSVVILWLVSECLADVLITIILIFHLNSNKTGMDGSDMLINRIIRVTIQTGMATTVCALIDLVLYLTIPVAWHLVFNVFLAKLYTNSLLSSLNSRAPKDGGTSDSEKSLMNKRMSMPVPPPQEVFIQIDEESASDSQLGVRRVVD